MAADDPILVLAETIPLINVPANTALEIECRFVIDERLHGKHRSKKLGPTETIALAKQIIRDAQANRNTCEMEQTINFICDDSSIKQLVFVNGIQQKDKVRHYQKEVLTNAIFVLQQPAYKIAVAFEHQIKPFDVTRCGTARIRLRFSITRDLWRYDITLVRQLNTLSNPADLKENKAQMLFAMQIDEFINRAPWDHAHHIEFEAEYVGDNALFTPDEFKKPSQFLNSYIDASNSEHDIDPVYQKAIYHVAQIIKPESADRFKHHFGLKQLSNQVIELNKNKFISNVLPAIDDYYITDKVDGVRNILYTENGYTALLGSTLVKRSVANLDTNTYVFDGELYNDAVYYIFDVLVWQGKLIANEPFETRLSYFEKAAKLNLQVDIQTKPFIRLSRDTYAKQTSGLQREKKPYETDGIVFTPALAPYHKMAVYKYKPLEKLSVDFLMKKCPKRLLGVKPYTQQAGRTLYLLFCGISRLVHEKLNIELITAYEEMFPHINTRRLPKYFPIQFEPSDRQFAYLAWESDDSLDGHIGEFIIRNPTSEHTQYSWQLINIRTDRDVELQRGTYFGNNYEVAEMIWMNYQDPLVINEEHRDDMHQVYFQEHDSETHRASRAFNNFVKSQIFSQYRATKTVMDMASGKGQDLFRYARYKMERVLFLEIDRTALTELIERKHSFSKQKNPDHLHVLTQRLDLNQPYKENIERIEKSNLVIPKNGFELIICNMAMHYLICGKSFITNIVRFISHYLRPGGRFVFTAFDGEAVFNLLADGKGEWKSQSSDKFHIKKEFKESSFAPYGQKISVRLPFSKTDYYQEYLVNIDYLEGVFEKHNMVLETVKSFADYLPAYKKEQPDEYAQMDDDDRTYTSLYYYYGFYKRQSGK